MLHPSLAKFQGPSLLAYNDAVFTDEDWTNIQKLKRSDKRSDPFKIGKFGVGFNSVFHITGRKNLLLNTYTYCIHSYILMWIKNSPIMITTIFYKCFKQTNGIAKYQDPQ